MVLIIKEKGLCKKMYIKQNFFQNFKPIVDNHTFFIKKKNNNIENKETTTKSNTIDYSASLEVKYKLFIYILFMHLIEMCN